MNKINVKDLVEINTRPENRKIFTEKILKQPKLIEELLSIIQTKDDKLSGKAARALELCCIQNKKLIFQHFQQIIIIAKNAEADNVIRPLAKILELWTLEHQKKNSFQLKADEQKEIIAIAFDWLITPQKIAPQAYSMQTLYILGKETDWVHPELKMILEQGYAKGSAGYKSRSRKIIELINKKS